MADTLPSHVPLETVVGEDAASRSLLLDSPSMSAEPMVEGNPCHLTSGKTVGRQGRAGNGGVRRWGTLHRVGKPEGWIPGEF